MAIAPSDAPAAPPPADRAPDRPPVQLYLPGFRERPRAAAVLMAELIAAEATEGAGTFTVEGRAAAGGAPLDGRRVKDGRTGRPVLDVYGVDYRRSLLGDARPDAASRIASPLFGLVGAVRLLVPARRRAKTRMAKFQLLLGVLSVVALAAAVLLAVWSALAAFHVVPGVDAGVAWLTGVVPVFVAGALVARLPSAVARSADVLAQFVTFAQDDRFATTAAKAVRRAVDAVLEDDPDAEIHLLGYSFGALVGIEFLAPRRSVHPPEDDTRRAAVRTFSTAGCPADMLRLFVPRYLEDRSPLPDGVTWTNAFVPADVLGSNFANRTDRDPTGSAAVKALPARSALPQTSVQPQRSVRYTDERLSLLSVVAGRGFGSHDAYWGRPDEDSCLRVLTPAFVRTA